MDEKTKLSYADNAQKFSADWRSQPPPADMYKLLLQHFIPGGETADIGCGDGRDAGWLSSQDFKVRGYDASSDLISLARKHHPDIEFKEATLPKLSEITETFENVLCETVIMHLPVAEVQNAIQSLKRITRTGGVIYLSWRVTEEKDVRSPDGRLYSAFAPELVMKNFSPERILHFEDSISESSGKRVCRLLYRKE